MGNYEKDFDGLRANDMDNRAPDAGRPVSFDILIFRFAPLLISLEPEDIELIKMAYLSAIRNNMVIDNNLLTEALNMSERTLRNRKNKIIDKINLSLGLDNGKTFPPDKNT
ncbi:MAG: hypothetical protein V1871_08310 [Planctomycetota bacterium]